MLMAKKFILFVVEGFNDKQEIEAILRTPYFDAYRGKYDCRTKLVKNDITADKNTHEGNIVHRIEEVVNQFRRDPQEGLFSGIKPQDIQEIVHVVDMDGAFIPRDGIERGDYPEPYYTDTSIITSNVDGIAGRNNKKQRVLRRLMAVDKIAGINYSLYYASRDMDHVLFNKPNSNRKSKGWDAKTFSDKCLRTPQCLTESFFKEGIAFGGTYEESCMEIQKGYNSLHRGTNLNLFFGEQAKHAK
jgi:hypothetical protein